MFIHNYCLQVGVEGTVLDLILPRVGLTSHPCIYIVSTKSHECASGEHRVQKYCYFCLRR